MTSASCRMRALRFYGSVCPLGVCSYWRGWFVSTTGFQPATTSKYPQGRALTYLLSKDLQVNLGSKFRKI